jgi:hypothetical protein
MSLGSTVLEFATRVEESSIVHEADVPRALRHLHSILLGNEVNSIQGLGLGFREPDGSLPGAAKQQCPLEMEKNLSVFVIQESSTMEGFARTKTEDRSATTAPISRHPSDLLLERPIRRAKRVNQVWSCCSNLVVDMKHGGKVGISSPLGACHSK